LNRHIVSQHKAKRIIAQAVRNKYRMTQIEGEIKDSMRPSNILVFGRSGSGKTEIFRRISKIYNAPFIRVEATKYTEVGYHGDDITSIITDLFKKTQAELANQDGQVLLKGSKIIKQKVQNHILKCLLGRSNTNHPDYQEKLKQLEEGLLEEYPCFICLRGDKKYTQFFAILKVKEIRKHMYDAYLEDLLQMIDVEEFVKDECENKAIVVIDEIDKLVRSPESTSSSKASDEGVQYDMLPLLDGTSVTVNSKIKVNTRNMLFVGAGAFEKTKPTELAIELQGRMPIRAKMEPLSLEDF
jgi:ATP-dependent HslUV protease ATP-binding subunit HslU